MARARNIKPSFFLNEDLVELPFSTRLLFIGLWTIADREGRLNDKPRQIKMSIFPGDDVDVDKGLQELADSQFIKRYAVKGDKYIEITNFGKHQNPHIREAVSTIPAPCSPRVRTKRATLIPESPLPITEAKEEAPEPPQAATPQPRATRIPDPFLLTSEMKAYAAGKRPGVDVIEETEKFVNYYRAKGGRDGAKLDWPATWRNWILNARVSNGNGKPIPFSPGQNDPEREVEIEGPCGFCGEELCLKDHRDERRAA
jgi:hypothetical protein